MTEAVWHDIECGSYREDLALWRELARRHGPPVLDVGCGTGRVALELARCGAAVIALDSDPELIAALRARAGRLPVEAVVADARSFSLKAPVPTIVVPMQTVQLLGGEDGRRRFLRCARAALAPGGVLAIAIADALDAFCAPDDLLPTPDMREIDGVVYASRPMAVVDEGSGAAIHRLREVVHADGGRSETQNVVRLDALDADTLEAEARAAGLEPQPRVQVPATDEYVGSTVVVLGG